MAFHIKRPSGGNRRAVMILHDRESGPTNLRLRTSPYASLLRAYETIMRPGPR
jgi:hypothetical protein